MSLRISRDILQTSLAISISTPLRESNCFLFFLRNFGREIGAKSTEIDLLAHTQRMTADQRKKYNSQRDSWYSRGILIVLLCAIWFPLCCDSHSTSWPLQETSRSGHHKRYTRNL